MQSCLVSETESNVTVSLFTVMLLGEGRDRAAI